MDKYEVVRESLEAIEKELSAVAEQLITGDDYRGEQRAKRIWNVIGLARLWLGVCVEAAKTAVGTEALND